MKIQGQELDVNILEELQQFPWEGDRVVGNKFQACSPFREESHPSFAVNLDNGTWVDSGSITEYLHKGNFVKLLALLRQDSYDTIEDYLITAYGTVLADTDGLTLEIPIELEHKTPPIISRSRLCALYEKKTDYLTNRNISEDIQHMFEVGYSDKNKSIALIWTDKHNQVVNIKYRRIDSKKFYYYKDGQRIREHLYGLYQCIKSETKRIYICESEIDALTLWSCGIPAVALGGSSISDRQFDLLMSCDFTEFVIATDNDKVGRRIADFLVETFTPFKKVFLFPFPVGKKDINEIELAVLQDLSAHLKVPEPFTFNLKI